MGFQTSIIIFLFLPLASLAIIRKLEGCCKKMCWRNIHTLCNFLIMYFLVHLAKVPHWLCMSGAHIKDENLLNNMKETTLTIKVVAWRAVVWWLLVLTLVPFSIVLIIPFDQEMDPSRQRRIARWEDARHGQNKVIWLIERRRNLSSS